MARPQREQGAARQLGHINNILQSQSRAPRDNRSANRVQKQTNGDARKQWSSHRTKLQDRITRDEQSKQSRHTTSKNSSTRLQDRITRVEQPQKSQQTSRGNLNTFNHQEEGRPPAYQPSPATKDQRRSSLPRQRQDHGSHEDRSSVSKPVEKKRKLETALLVSKCNVNNQRSSGKRKRDTNDIEDDKESKEARKKHKAAYQESQRSGQLPPQTSVDTTSSAAKAAVKATYTQSSFAPVTPNHDCDLNFLDYLDDSIPVLYSSLVEHASDTELLNSPSDTLVLEALTAIEASTKPHTKPDWPTAIELLLKRSPTKSYPTKVLDDVDLYLHESETGYQLHVATDRGLLLVTEYLKLIGVPETQPIRLEGRVPPWAKAALGAREKRRVVQTWGQVRVIREGIPLESHQVSTLLKRCDEVREQRVKRTTFAAPQPSWRAVTTRTSPEGDDNLRKAEKEATSQAEAAAQAVPEPERSELEILEAEPGHLPLPSGSVVVVYKTEYDGFWAYGRLSGTNKTGRFPMFHTCPLDWSLDQFSGTNDTLCRPLIESQDPDEKDWNGLFHWVKQQGFQEGPTWKETLAAAAAKAKDDKAQIIATRGMRARMEATSSREVKLDKTFKEAPIERAPLDEALSTAQRASATTAAIATTEPSTVLATEPEVQKSSEEVPGKKTENSFAHDGKEIGVSEDRVSDKKTENTVAHDTKENGFTESQVILPADSAEASDDVSGTQNATSPVSVAAKDAELETDFKTGPTADREEREPVTEGIAEEPKMPVQTEQENEDGKVKAADDGETTPPNPFTVPRLSMFARNDDIEVDWGDSDEEL